MKDSSVTRRDLITLAGTAGLLAPLTAAAQQPTPPKPREDDSVLIESFPENGQQALARLKAGNLRFVAGNTRHAHEGANWRKHLVGTQKPIAVVLGCSDSRVPPELVFDQGFGDLFVIRVAGNVIATDVVGSIVYAALHLKTPLFVVMGHSGCGAVTATLDAKLKGAKEPESIAALLKLVEPSLKNVDLSVPFTTALAAAIEANVRWSVEQLKELPGAKAALAASRIAIAGAVYDLQTGVVRFLEV